MITDYLKGAAYIFSGCRNFYCDCRAWKYAAIPLSIMFFLYCFAFLGVFFISGKLAAFLSRSLSALPPVLSWLSNLAVGFSYVLGLSAALFLLGSTICLIYEMFGSIFFDSLVEYFEEKKYGIPPLRFSLNSAMKSGMDSMMFAAKNAVNFILLCLLGIFFPLIGHILLFMVVGYHTGLTYMICSAHNSRIPISGLCQAGKEKYWMVLGFGATGYFLLLIPFATIILLPGLALGGAELFNQELKQRILENSQGQESEEINVGKR